MENRKIYEHMEVSWNRCIQAPTLQGLQKANELLLLGRCQKVCGGHTHASWDGWGPPKEAPWIPWGPKINNYDHNWQVIFEEWTEFTIMPRDLNDHLTKNTIFFHHQTREGGGFSPAKMGAIKMRGNIGIQPRLIRNLWRGSWFCSLGLQHGLG